MQPIPKDILEQFDAILKERNIPVDAHNHYRKWLRYFLDFRTKHSPSDSRSDQVRMFAEKLRSKNQTPQQLEQAADAVSLYFALQKRSKSYSSTASKQAAPATAFPQSAPEMHTPVTLKVNDMVCEPPASSTPYPPCSRGGKQYDEWRCLKKTESPEWDDVIAKLAAEIKLRHYSRNTLKHYADWSRKFQSYLKNKSPEALSPAEVNAYLT